MDVNYPKADESSCHSHDVLVREMVECQNELNMAYNNKLNRITADYTSLLQEYLDRNNPGLVVPFSHQDPHFHFVKNSFEDMAFLTLEFEDLTMKFLKYSELQNDVLSHSHSLLQADGSPKTLEETKGIFKFIHESMGIVAPLRVDMERKTWGLTLRFQMLKALAQTFDAPTSQDGHGHHDDDDLLGILTKGILLSIHHDSYELILSSFRKMWPRLKKTEELSLELVNEYLMKLLITHQAEVAVDEGQEETLQPEEDSKGTTQHEDN